MADKKMSRRERDKLRQRKEILSTALGLFSEKGYHNVTMHEIAQKTEFAIGTLYNFFKNKEDLYKAMILEQMDRYHDELMKAIAGPADEMDKLRNYSKMKGELFRADISLIRLYFAEVRGAGYNSMTDLYAEIRQRYDHFLQNLAGIFEKGIKQKHFRNIAEPYYLAVAVEGITNAFLFQWLDAPEQHPYPENPDDILNILFQGLMEQ